MRNYYSAIALFCSSIAFMFFCYILIMYTLWTVSNSTFLVLFILFVFVIYILIKEFKQLTRLKKIFTIIINTLSFIFTGLILVYFALKILIFLVSGAEHLFTSNSPNRHYTLFDTGAMGTFGIRAELDGPLGFKKQIYYERHGEEANVQWVTDEIVIINGHKLNLKSGDTFGYTVPERGK